MRSPVGTGTALSLRFGGGLLQEATWDLRFLDWLWVRWNKKEETNSIAGIGTVTCKKSLFRKQLSYCVTSTWDGGCALGVDYLVAFHPSSPLRVKAPSRLTPEMGCWPPRADACVDLERKSGISDVERGVLTVKAGKCDRVWGVWRRDRWKRLRPNCRKIY